jgi:hypothetical protein
MLLFFFAEIMYVTSSFFLRQIRGKHPLQKYTKKRHLYFLAKFSHVGEGMRLLSPVRCFLLCFSLGWTEIPARLILTACKSDGLHANYSELDWNLGVLREDKLKMLVQLSSTSSLFPNMDLFPPGSS